MDLVELVGQLVIVALGYAIGAAALWGVLRLAGVSFPLGAPVLLVLGLPLAMVCAAEAATGLWQHTPGTAGLGGLVVFVPMLLAGAAVSAVAAVTLHLAPAFDPSLPRRTDVITLWIGIAFLSGLIPLLLWRYWPEPTARLW